MKVNNAKKGVALAVAAAAAAGVENPAADAGVIFAEGALDLAEDQLWAAELICFFVKQTAPHRESEEYLALYSSYDPVDFEFSIDDTSSCTSTSFVNDDGKAIRFIQADNNTSNSTFSFTTNITSNIRIRAIAGGGGGSSGSGGGGGAGCYIDKEFTFPSGTYSCTIGAGGLGGGQGINNGEAGFKGNSTIISDADASNVLTLYGGGGGKNSTGNYASSAGGDVYTHSTANSAVVGPCYSKTGFFDVELIQYQGFGTANIYANRGGNAAMSDGWGQGFAGAGGGGAAQAGFDNSSNATSPGLGGAGVTVALNAGVSTYVGGGGGGGNYYAPYAAAGSYGGGAGGSNTHIGGNATVGTGGGGGGGGSEYGVSSTDYTQAGSGASGFICLEFLE